MLYYLFIVTGSDGALKGQFLVAENSERTVRLREHGKIPKDDVGYYLEFSRPSETSDGSEADLIALFPGAGPPPYERTREAVTTFIIEHLQS